MIDVLEQHRDPDAVTLMRRASAQALCIIPSRAERGAGSTYVLLLIVLGFMAVAALWLTSVDVAIDVEIRVRGTVRNAQGGGAVSGATVLICRVRSVLSDANQRSQELRRHERDHGYRIRGESAVAISAPDGQFEVSLPAEGSYMRRRLMRVLGLGGRSATVGGIMGFAVRHDDFKEHVTQLDGPVLVAARSAETGGRFVAFVDLGDVALQPK